MSEAQIKQTYAAEDIRFMRRAIELAEGGVGGADPNPLVGAVLVRDGRIVGEGWHQRCGEAHAEVNALRSCKDPRGTTAYVTLEPCCHWGKTPPCADALIKAGVSRVVVGMTDMNPKVAGGGIKRLRDAGVEVVTGVLEQECAEQNRVFVKYMTTGLPYAALKYAMTLDGRIATKTGDSKWITGEAARAHVHTLRARYMGIMVGIGTVLADDPMLNCRIEGEFAGIKRDPVRIVCDSSLRIPMDSKLVTTADHIRTIVATVSEDAEKLAALRGSGVETVRTAPENGRVSLTELMRTLGSMGINGLMIEGGGEMAYSALKAGLVSRIYAYVAPKLVGGSAKSPVGGEGVSAIADAFRGRIVRTAALGEDMLLECDVLSERGPEGR